MGVVRMTTIQAPVRVATMRRQRGDSMPYYIAGNARVYAGITKSGHFRSYD
jgi:hypothetical protein